jgi:hypothetical protein
MKSAAATAVARTIRRFILASLVVGHGFADAGLEPPT